MALFDASTVVSVSDLPALPAEFSKAVGLPRPSGPQRALDKDSVELNPPLYTGFGTVESRAPKEKKEDGQMRPTIRFVNHLLFMRCEDACSQRATPSS